MRVVILFLLLNMLAQSARSSEIRSYKISEEILGELRVSGGDPFSGKEMPPLKLIKEALFVSRFFSLGDVLIDCSDSLGDSHHPSSVAVKAVFNRTTQSLVVSAPSEIHFNLYEALKDRRPKQLRVSLSVMKLPEITLGFRSYDVADLPEGTTLLGKVSGLMPEGVNSVVQLPEGALVVEAELLNYSAESFEGRFAVTSKLEGHFFQFKSAFWGEIGTPILLELSGDEGGRSRAIILQVDSLKPDGSAYSDFVEKEVGGGLLESDRIEPSYPGTVEKVRRRYSLPPTFKRLISTNLKDGEDKSIRELLMANGIAFQADDQVTFLEASNTLIVIAPTQTIDLIEYIVKGGGPTPHPRMIEINVSEVESVGKLSVESLSDGDFKILRKMTTHNLPGQVATQKVGEAVFQTEAQLTANMESIEIRATLFSSKEKIFSGGLIAEERQPLIFRQSKQGDRWRSYVVTCSSVRTTDAAE